MLSERVTPHGSRDVDCGRDLDVQGVRRELFERDPERVIDLLPMPRWRQ